MNKGQSSGSMAAQSPLFQIGMDRCGHWVVRDERGLRGGLFVDRAQAIRFAMLENGHRPRAFVVVPWTLELDLHDGSDAPAEPASPVDRACLHHS